MKDTIPLLMSATAFEPADLAIMQSVFEEACQGLGEHPEIRAEVATTILNTYSAGERNRQELLNAALKVLELQSTSIIRRS